MTGAAEFFGRWAPAGGGGGRENGGGPALLVLTDRRQACRHGLVAAVAAAVEGGARAVLVREKDLPAEERVGLVQAFRALLDPVDGAVLLAGPDVELALRSGAAGLHLAAADPWPATGQDLVIGRSCHTAGELAEATEAGADYATLSPVFPSLSKPGYGPALGSEGLEAMVADVSIPVVALGGITPATVAACVSAGAAGVAVMGTVMAAEDPGAAAAALVTSLAPAPEQQAPVGNR